MEKAVSCALLGFLQTTKTLKMLHPPFKSSPELSRAIKVRMVKRSSFFFSIIWYDDFIVFNPVQCLVNWVDFEVFCYKTFHFDPSPRKYAWASVFTTDGPLRVSWVQCTRYAKRLPRLASYVQDSMNYNQGFNNIFGVGNCFTGICFGYQ